jgi:hypothetical protein
LPWLLAARLSNRAQSKDFLGDCQHLLKTPKKLPRATLRNKMGRLGFEPRTSRLKAEYSTVELATLRKRYGLAVFSTDDYHSISF